MKYFILPLLILTVACAQLFAQQTTPQKQTQDEPKPPMKAFAPITRADEKLDILGKVPQNTALIPTAAILYKNDPVICIPSVIGAVKNDGDKFSLKFKFSSGKVGGKFKTIAEDVYNGYTPNKKFIINLPFTLAYTFEDSDEYGKYEIKFEVENTLTGEKAQSVTPLELRKWQRPEPIKDPKQFAKAMVDFNSSFDPQTVYSIFISPNMRYYDKNGDFAFAVYTFTKTVFTRHKFMLDKLAREFPKAEKKQRENTIQLFEFLGEGYRLQGLDKTETALRDSVWNITSSLPKIGEIPASGIELDMLWGEFFGAGTFEPIQKIMNCVLKNSSQCMKFSELSCAGKDLKKSMSQGDMFKGVTAISACWSLMANYNANVLAKKYITFYLNNMKPADAKAFNDAITSTNKYLQQRKKSGN